jgi:hypothetical protein
MAKNLITKDQPDQNREQAAQMGEQVSGAKNGPSKAIGASSQRLRLKNQ